LGARWRRLAGRTGRWHGRILRVTFTGPAARGRFTAGASSLARGRERGKGNASNVPSRAPLGLPVFVRPRVRMPAGIQGRAGSIAAGRPPTRPAALRCRSGLQRLPPPSRITASCGVPSPCSSGGRRADMPSLGSPVEGRQSRSDPGGAAAYRTPGGAAAYRTPGGRSRLSLAPAAQPPIPGVGGAAAHAHRSGLVTTTAHRRRKHPSPADSKHGLSSGQQRRYASHTGAIRIPRRRGR
jgi:hypothetical protein